MGARKAYRLEVVPGRGGELSRAAAYTNGEPFRLKLPLKSSLPELLALKRPTARRAREPQDKNCARIPMRDPVEWYITPGVAMLGKRGKPHRCPCRAIANAAQEFICCRTKPCYVTLRHVTDYIATSAVHQ